MFRLFNSTSKFFWVSRLSMWTNIPATGVKKALFSEKINEERTESQKALDYVQELFEKGAHKEALREIDLLEEKYPVCSKAAKYYRGKVSVAVLKKTGELEEIKQLYEKSFSQ